MGKLRTISRKLCSFKRDYRDRDGNERGLSFDDESIDLELYTGSTVRSAVVKYLL